jgi:thiol-disulfide isomerase/thioredoxin
MTSNIHPTARHRPISVFFCSAAWLSLIVASGCSSHVATGSAQPSEPTSITSADGRASGGAMAGEPDDQQPTSVAADQPAATSQLPRLVDLGAKQCIPCKMMAPILQDLMENYTDSFETEFIDVWEKPDEADKYGIQTIPTQIFFDAAGKEQFRHEGFMSKEDILAAWAKLGVQVNE